MNKYESLCESYSQSRKRFYDNKHECYKFAKTVARALIEYLSIPPQQYCFIALDQEPEEQKRNSVEGAFSLGEDLYWHFGIRFTFYEKPNLPPHDNVLLDIMIKKGRKGFLLILKGKKRVFLKDFTDYNDKLGDFCDYVYESIKQVYEANPMDYLDKEIVTRSIEFRSTIHDEIDDKSEEANTKKIRQ